MPHRILVIDDDSSIRQLVEVILSAAGYLVETTSRGADALSILEARDFHLVLLDIMMPDVDGWEVCREIKSRPRTRHIPVVFLTVRDQPLDRVIGLEVVRADAYVTKPFDREHLLDKINELLGLDTPALD